MNYQLRPKKIFFILFSLFIFLGSAQNNFPIFNTAQAVVKPGVFVNQCFYGANKSISDHAPIIFKNNRFSFATWNIAYQASGTYITPAQGEPFLVHKFHNLRSNQPVDEREQQYERRLKRIAQKIIKIMKTNQIKIMALQEVSDNENHRQILKSELSKRNFEIVFATWDMAVVFPKTFSNKRLVAKDPDMGTKLFPVCNSVNKFCFVSLHLKWAGDDDTRVDRCKGILDLKSTLEQEGFKKFYFIGDFNKDARSYYQSCQNLEGFNPIMYTYKGKGKSCSDNAGRHAEKNIDLLWEF